MNTAKVTEAASLAHRDLDDFDEANNPELIDVVVVSKIRYDCIIDGHKHYVVRTASTTDDRMNQSGMVSWALDLIDESGEPSDIDDIDE